MCFTWGVSKEMIPSSVYEALRTVPALSAGRSDAAESAPVKPVAEEHAAAIFSFLSPQIQAMVELQALTGMRPGEVCMMRGCDVTTSEDKTWCFKPSTHKTAHHGHDRVIDLGPQAREPTSVSSPPRAQAARPRATQGGQIGRRWRARSCTSGMMPTCPAPRPARSPASSI